MHRLTEFMHRLTESSQHLAEQLGGAGLLVVAFLDSSFITLPEVADFLVIIFTIREPDRWLYFATVTMIGSTAGCYVLYALARMGGRAMVRRGFHERHIDRVLSWFRSHGSLVLIVPALLPPPMPFKVFVLVAGISGIPPLKFLVAVVVGRGVRYGGEAWLARHYGDDAIRFLKEDAAHVLWVIGVLSLVALAAWWLWRRQRTPGPGPGGPGSQAGADVE
jgi:membrane protein YqaA with SNARE-associated domain